MKTKILFSKMLFISMILIASNCISQDWDIVYSTEDKLNFAYFFNDNIVYCTGDSGTIVRSVDAGENWVKLKTGTKKSIRGIYFVDQFNGFACGQCDILLKTKDGGYSWENIHEIDEISCDEVNSNRRSIYMKDTMMGVMVYGGGIEYTFNGWETSSTGEFGDYLDIQSIGDDLFIAIYGDNIKKSNDHGISWINTHPSLSDIESIKKGFYVDENTIYVMSNERIYRSNYMSWDIDYGGLASSLFFTDAENGYLCTLSGKVYQRKGKENWEEQYSVDFCLSYLTVKNNVVISVGDSGIIRKEIPNIKYDTIVFIDTVRVYDTIRIEDLIKIFDTVEVEVEKIIEALSVIDFNSLDIDNNDPEMLVYPNPVGDYFYLDCIGYKNVFVELYDLKGMLLYKGKVDKKKFKISMEGMSPGMYILNIVFKGNSMKPVKIKKI